jgi:hypothetical protein
MKKKKKQPIIIVLYISAHLTQNSQKSTETAGFTPAVPVDFRSFYILSTFFPPFPDTADTVCRHLPLLLQTAPSLPSGTALQAPHSVTGFLKIP